MIGALTAWELPSQKIRKSQVLIRQGCTDFAMYQLRTRQKQNSVELAKQVVSGLVLSIDAKGSCVLGSNADILSF
jgi:hypothetical protein